MNMLQDIITYVRRIIKSPSNAVITDSLIVDYINRFWLMDVDARIQLFDLKTTYQFMTQPGVDQYNMPLYSIQGNTLQPNIASFPVYQGYVGPCTINGVNVSFNTQRELFNTNWNNFVQQMIQVSTGNGTSGPYTLTLPFLSNNIPPVPQYISSVILRGHVDITGIIVSGIAPQDPPITNNLITSIPVMNTFPAVYFTSIDSTGANVIVADSGQFLTGAVNYGLLMQPGPAPNGNLPLSNGLALPTPYATNQNTINYFTGVAQNVFFPTAIPNGQPISASCYFYQTGIPRSVLYYNNTLTLRAPPNTQYLVELQAYLTPAAFLNEATALPFGYMAEYIARGAARKILADTGDTEQFAFYEPLFKEQESLVWKRSQRQFTSTRTHTIYSNNGNNNNVGFGTNNFGGQ